MGSFFVVFAASAFDRDIPFPGLKEQSMKRGVLAYLSCPSCHSELRAELPPPAPDGEYMSGTLHCSGCGHRYPIRNGVPRMVVTSQEPGGAAETFGFEWRKHGEKQMEGETVFGRTKQQDMTYFLEATRLSPDDVRGAVVLDAGCGSGQVTEGIGEMGARAVIGIDVNTAVDFPFRRCRHMPNVHIVQADIQALPFRHGLFDLVWSNGVIHHTGNTPAAFESLAARVKPQGKLYVWVYEKRQSPFVTVGEALRAVGVHQRLSLRSLHRLSRTLAVTSLVLHTAYRAIRGLPLWRTASFGTDRATRFRSRGAFELTWFDILSPKYAESYTRNQIAAWFGRQGFGNLAFYPDQIGICGIKQLTPAVMENAVTCKAG
jgi:SAM-dependent methyltransferase/uncharacterized protein YbaR (Trm112 family)